MTIILSLSKEMNNTFCGLSGEVWIGAVFGAILGAIVIPLVLLGVKWCINRIINSRPRNKLLGSIANNDERCTIFIRDFLLPKNSQILTKESANLQYGAVPNVVDFWADADGIGMGYVLNALGQAGKRRNIEVARMSQDIGVWDTNLIIIGAQAQKNFDFYDNLENVTYKVGPNDIIDKKTGQIINREGGYGYGVILKARNQFKTKAPSGLGFVIGGFGTLGTKAAAYYFSQHLTELGKQFGSRYFGVVVRAPVRGGEQMVERLPQYDRVD
jgi:hypothetical protein